MFEVAASGFDFEKVSIQGEGLVKKLLVLVLSGALMFNNEQRVVKYESSKSVRVEGGLVMREVKFRSLMKLW